GVRGRRWFAFGGAPGGVPPTPPYSRGHVGTTKPDAANTGYHASYSARVRTSRTAAAPPRRPASIHGRGTFASTHSRTSSTFTWLPRCAIHGSAASARLRRSSPFEARRPLFAERGEPFAEVGRPRR